MAAVLVLLASWRAPSVGAANTGIAVVVGPESSLTAASLEELKEYYLGERTNVPSGDTAQPTMRPAGSAEKEIFLRRIVGMSERDFKQHWLARIYRGESSSTPLVLDSDVSVRRYVTQVSSAIGYIDLNAQTTGLRVLLVIRDPQ